MISKFKADLQIDAKNKTKAIYDSISIDNKFYPENPTKTEISLDKRIKINIEANHLPHFRASLNSILRLTKASYDSLETVKV